MYVGRILSRNLNATVDNNTGKYREFIAMYCYECEAQVTMQKAMNKWYLQGIVILLWRSGIYRFSSSNSLADKGP